MPIKPIDSYLMEQFLRILAVDKRRPSSGALTELVAAYLMRIPFENVSKLYYMTHHRLRNLPKIERYMDGINRFNFGGTCYSNNYYLHLLLKYLGYDVMLCGADMSNPDVHVVNIVSLDGREFIVDAGYAAPFLEPLPRDLSVDYVITLGYDRYVLKPQNKNGNSHLEVYRDGQLKHGYVVKPISREIGYFDQVIVESFRKSATFMNALLLVKQFPNRSIVIHNLSVMEAKGTNYTIRQLASRNELPAIVEENFSIPQEIVSEAVAELGEFGDAWK